MGSLFSRVSEFQAFMNSPKGQRMMADIQRRAMDVARDELTQKLDEGTICPCCGQHAKRYKRKIHSGMARWLIWLVREYAASGGQWVDIKRSPQRGGDYAKLGHWGLIEQAPPDTTHNRSGMWRPTQKGFDFAHNVIRVPAYVLMYNGQIDGWAPSTVSIRDALGEKFDYLQLMGLD